MVRNTFGFGVLAKGPVSVLPARLPDDSERRLHWSCSRYFVVEIIIDNTAPCVSTEFVLFGHVFNPTSDDGLESSQFKWIKEVYYM
jgi:hypothetical protein